jgi:uncharacterized protein YciI
LGEIGEAELDETIKSRVATGKPYFLLLLKRGDRFDAPDHPEDLQIQHLRHQFRLRAKGVFLVGGPMTDDGDLRGIGIIAAENVKAVEEMMSDDPAVVAGRLRVELHPMFGLPGDALS